MASAGVGFLSLTLEGRIAALDERGAAMLGIETGTADGGDIAGQPLGRYLEGDFAASVLPEARLHGSVNGAPLTFETADGEWKHLWAHVTLQQGPGAQELLTFLLRETRDAVAPQLEASAVAAHMTDFVGVTDLAGVFIEVWPSVRDLLDYEPAELTGTQALDLVHPEDLPYVRKAYADFIKGETDGFRLDYRNRHRDGRYLWAEVRARILRRAETQQRHALVITARDITARKGLEHELSVSRERYRLLSDLRSDLVFSLSRNEKGGWSLEWQDGPYERLTGYTPAELESMDAWTSLVHAADRGPAERIAARLELGEAAVFAFRLTCKDGSVRWFEESAYPLLDAEGRVTRIAGSLRDITDLQRTGQALKQSEQDYRQLVESVNSAVIRYDAQGVFTFANDYALRFFGYEGEGLVGRHVAETLLPAEDSEGRDLSVLVEDALNAPEEFVAFENENVRSDGSRVWMSWTNRPIRDAAGRVTGMVCVGNDVTARRRAQRELEQREEHERAVARMLRTLHDVTTELSASGCFDELCRRAVELGRDRLGLERLSLWFTTSDPGVVAGSYGVSKHGELRDERQSCVPLRRGSVAWQCVYGGERFAYRTEAFLLDDRAEPCDRGHLACAALWDGQEVTGFLSTDTLPSGRAFTNIELQTVRLYADSLGYLCTRQRAVDALRESEEKFRLISEQSLMGIAILQDDVVKYVNTAFTQVFGYSEPEALAWEPGRFLGVVHPEDRGFIAEHSRMTQLGLPGAMPEYTYRVLRKDGEVAWLDQRSQTVIYEGRTADLVMCVEATARIQAGEALRRSKEQLELALEGAGLGMWDWFVQDGRVAVDDRWLEVYGYSPDEVDIVDAGFMTRHTHPEDAPLPEEAFARHASGQASHFECEHRIVTKDHAVRRVLERGRIVERNPLGEPIRVTGTMRDVTEIRRQEEERRRLELQMQQTQKLESLGVMAGGIAHDFNNVLMGILGYADLARMELPEESPACDSLKAIVRSAQRAADLANQMLAYSGRGELRFEQLDLTALIRDMADFLRVSVSKKAALQMDLAEGPPRILGDATQVRQIVLNLVMNASEALGEDAGTIELHCGPAQMDGEKNHGVVVGEPLTPGRYVELAVRDSGPGIAPDVMARAFDPFYTTKFTGRGLGLATVLGIVRGHGGAIAVESEPGEGAVFRVYLPVAEPVADEEAGAPTDPPARDVAFTGVALLAEDEATVRELACLMLERLGLEVDAARDGGEALRLFQRDPQRYAVVILDLTMPVMGGEEALAAMRNVRPDVPALVCSGFSDREHASRFAGLGAAGFVQKPFTLSDLREALANAVA